jgi:hypothetical protein
MEARAKIRSSRLNAEIRKNKRELEGKIREEKRQTREILKKTNRLNL